MLIPVILSEAKDLAPATESSIDLSDPSPSAQDDKGGSVSCSR